ncbi:RNA-binding protein 28-like [Achroia grisella]|uniref:RNA-binding protein 28-like n=1 Tax=Achroia grisella TaxID=688607 RepID=UPI0027D26D4C|nr:RNA-binding protein 28-like [Achroia grisella]XP_059060959.1 RNA-binding protein 28-like [Achroia grisella]
MAPDSMEVEVTDNTKYKDGVNRNARLIVRNISFKATEDSLKDHFSQYGTVEEVKLLRKPDGRLVGCGFVHYTHVPMANEAIIATNKKPFLERPIYVSWAVAKHKYTEEADEKKPKKEFSNSTSEDFTIVKKEESGLENDKGAKEGNKSRINNNARLIVRNVSFKATEETLKEHFEPYGSLLEVKLLKKPDGKLVGCAFVHFKNVPMAKKALLSTNMKPFLGRPISVDWAVAKNKYMQHIVNQQLEMQEDVKKEDSDSDDDGQPLNISNDDLKQEIKSESDEDTAEDKNSDNDSESENNESDAEDASDDDDDDREDDSDMDDQQSETSMVPAKQRTKLNDAEDGCTVFIVNIPFSIENDQLKQFAEQTGPVKYALVCVDKMTEHSKGTGFVKFVNKEDADKFLSLSADQLRLEGQVLQVKPALKRENLQKGDKKQPKDNRNLYLVKEGVVVAGTKAAVGVSASDMSKRLALERSKTQMLKNLNRFVSRYRIVVSNLPPNCDDARLRRLSAQAAGNRAIITEARVMRDLRAAPDRTGRQPSKGYGFVMFMRHEDALSCLRKLNNNPEIFDANNRPIVSFSIEDRTALNARKKRLEKSIANNPLANNTDNKKGRNRKRKMEQPDESYMKKRKFDKKKESNGFDNKINNTNVNENSGGKYVRRPREDISEYTGLTAKEGSQHKMRSNHKLKSQAEVHRQNVKLEKKKNKRSIRLKMAMKERIKLPKQKINKAPGKKHRKKAPHHKTGTQNIK